MRLDLPPLGALRVFEAVARLASFKRAAAELLVTPTAVSHQIRQLEAHLGFRVLNRNPRHVALTAEGRLLHEATVSGFAEIVRSLDELRRLRARPIFTLSATPAFLSQWLVPRLVDLQAVLPELDIRLHASDAMVDLTAEGINVAIRYGKGPFPGISATPLCDDIFLAVCSPGLGIACMEDLVTAKLIHIDGRVAPKPIPHWPLWCKQAGIKHSGMEAGMRFTDSQHALQAAVAGRGVAIVSQILASEALSSGLLVAPFDIVLEGTSYQFACATELSDRADVGALRAWFAHSLEASCRRCQ